MLAATVETDRAGSSPWLPSHLLALATATGTPDTPPCPSAPKRRASRRQCPCRLCLTDLPAARPACTFMLQHAVCLRVLAAAFIATPPLCHATAAQPAAAVESSLKEGRGRCPQLRAPGLRLRTMRAAAHHHRTRPTSVISRSHSAAPTHALLTPCLLCQGFTAAGRHAGRQQSSEWQHVV